MNESDWFDFVCSQYNKSIENADALYPRYAIVLTAAAAVGGAHYALAIKLLRSYEMDNVAIALSACSTILGVFCLSATLYNITYALNVSGKFRQIKPLAVWEKYRIDQLENAARRYPDKNLAERTVVRDRVFQRFLAQRMVEAERNNRQVSDKRLKYARIATNNVIGSGAAALFSGSLQLAVAIIDGV